MRHRGWVVAVPSWALCSPLEHHQAAADGSAHCKHLWSPRAQVCLCSQSMGGRSAQQSRTEPPVLQQGSDLTFSSPLFLCWGAGWWAHVAWVSLSFDGWLSFNVDGKSGESCISIKRNLLPLMSGTVISQFNTPQVFSLCCIEKKIHFNWLEVFKYVISKYCYFCRTYQVKNTWLGLHLVRQSLKSKGRKLPDLLEASICFLHWTVCFGEKSQSSGSLGTEVVK